MKTEPKTITVLLVVPATIGGLWTAECAVETMHSSNCPLVASKRALTTKDLLSLCVCGMRVGKARIAGPLRPIE